MKLLAIIPDRGDRPKFLANCYRMMTAQTVQLDQVLIIDFKPTDNEKDITKRYRVGYNHAHKFDLVFFIENDDWYSPTYVETMLYEWEKHGKPDIFGTNRTIYYHLELHKWFYMHHYTRSMAMSTMLKSNLNIKWAKDNDPYTDIHLWQQIKGVTFRPEKEICMGMKHGVGLCGGKNHTDKLERFTEKGGVDYLSNIMDKESLNFYANICSQGS